MIGNSTPEYIWIRTWVYILHLIAPLSVTYCVVRLFVDSRIPRFFEYIALAETIFYVLTELYQRYYLQRDALHPPLQTPEQRNKLFDLCQDSTEDYTRYLCKWFLDGPLSLIKKENMKEFFQWAFLNSAVEDSSYDEEIEEYVKKFETRTGMNFEPGRGKVKCLRLTIDKVDSRHRSLIWYACIFVVDTLTHTYMSFHQFQFRRSSIRNSFSVFPWRPQTFIARRSPAKNLTYWFRPHTSDKSLPVLFLHGIGVGLYPYMEFLKELGQERNGSIGIIAIELLPISSRIVPAMLGKEEICRQIRDILDYHRIDKFVLVSHSYGSVISTHVLKTTNIADRVASVILVDPVSILLHQPDVAYNFTFRKPTFANEWLLWYFGSKDMGIAHTLSRRFFWSENILWKEDLVGHHATIFLGGRDSIINSAQVRAYLQPEETKETLKGVEMLQTSLDGHLDVIWCDNLDHGQVFDLSAWRNRLLREVLKNTVRTG